MLAISNRNFRTEGCIPDSNESPASRFRGEKVLLVKLDDVSHVDEPELVVDTIRKGLFERSGFSC